MSRFCRLEMIAFAAFVSGSCAPRAQFHPTPVGGEARSRAFLARGPHDPELARFLVTHDVSLGKSLHLKDLAFVALFYSADLDTARASLAVARAALITAGARPQPSAGATIGIPFAAGLSAGFPIETGGKRPARVDRARAAIAASEFRVRATGWRIAFDAEESGVIALAADRDLTAARDEREALSTVRDLLRARFAEGSISAAEVARADLDLQSATIGVTQAERAQLDARDTLARALALPVDSVRKIQILPDGAERISTQVPHGAQCSAADSLGSAPLQAMALGRRSDLGAALADYSVSEGDIRIEITRQYPDVNLGPGIAWDAGTLKWVLSLALPNLVLNRNRGPIAEAQARRAAAAARFDLVQQRIIREVSAARLECGGAREQLATASALVRASGRQLALARAAYQRGETGRTEMGFARLALVRATRSHLTSQQRLERAQVGLERALGGWPTGPTLSDADLFETLRSSDYQSRDRRP